MTVIHTRLYQTIKKGIQKAKILLSEIKQFRKAIYKITGRKKTENPNDEDHLIIQITGTAIQVPLTPSEIYQDDALINGFSPSDVKLISTLAMAASLKPKYYLVLEEFRNKMEDYTVTIGEKGITSKMKMSINELAKNIQILQNISPQDAFNIGRLFAENQVKQEKKALHKINKI